MDEERDRELELEALEERYSDCHWDDLMFMLGDGEKEIKQLKE